MAVLLIADITVHDAEAYKAYVAGVTPIVERFGGRYVVRGGAPANVEGDWQPQRLVAIQFKDRATAQAFVDDAEYAPIKAIRHQNADSRTIIVDADL